MLNKTILIPALLALSTLAHAQGTPSPVGLWQNVDDKTGVAKAQIRVVERGGELFGAIEKITNPDAKPGEVCDKCDDDRKGKPMLGLEIIRGAKKTDNADVWADGKILDPEAGREYKLRLTVTEGGKKLDVRGSWGPFGRTQTWTRINP